MATKKKNENKTELKMIEHDYLLSVLLPNNELNNHQENNGLLVFLLLFCEKPDLKPGHFLINKTNKVNGHQIEPEKQYHQATPLSKPEALDQS